jgi:soluble lytic murein transglycosylase-like protein
MADQRVIAIAAGALVGIAVWAMYRDQTAITAGDDESDLLTDTYDTMKSTFTGWPSGSEPYQDLIAQAAQANGVPVAILAWLLWKESRYNPAIIDGTKRSRVGAMGIAQFMPATARDEGINALDPAQAIPGAARYLARLYRSTGTWAEALAAYNWGIGNVQRKGIDAAPAETVDYYTTILGKAGYEATV